ncbi:allantoinase [Faunimonas pinastri]|uniref:Allantoinase n=1 Tax=Faunimonas pinastri TaxID=1855383 RepID=A0A1H9ENY8_9HYPH|nr:dihydroorotase family protein [Faunimonas pinastri]SEQ27335.1 allantoinase [Faunimonas pinastri]
MSFTRVITGRVVTPTGIVDSGWIAFASETISAIGKGAPPAADTVDDYADAYLLPGGIDGQTHAGSQIGFPGMGPTTRAAVMGGVTTIVDMPYDEPDPVTDGAVLAAKIAGIGAYAVCDVALYGTVTPQPDPAHVRELIDGGVCAFKISSFEAHPTRFPRIGNAATRALAELLGGTGLPLGLHNEDQEIVRATASEFIAAGKTDPEFHSASRPEVAELTATANFMELGVGTGSHLHIVHISTPDGFEIVRRYREAGLNASAEMCVHYLHFDDEVDTPRLGGLLKVNPPIRAGRREALWQVLETGNAAFVSSDHSAWPLDRKNKPSIFDVAAGMPGLETLLPALFTDAAARHGADRAASMVADLTGDRPARFFGLAAKGKLAPGFDADVAVMASRPMRYDSSRNPESPGWSAYDGEEFAVTPVATYVRGRLVWDGGKVTADPGSGRFVPRAG